MSLDDNDALLDVQENTDFVKVINTSSREVSTMGEICAYCNILYLVSMLITICLFLEIFFSSKPKIILTLIMGGLTLMLGLINLLWMYLYSKENINVKYQV